MDKPQRLISQIKLNCRALETRPMTRLPSRRRAFSPWVPHTPASTDASRRAPLPSRTKASPLVRFPTRLRPASVSRPPLWGRSTSALPACGPRQGHAGAERTLWNASVDGVCGRDEKGFNSGVSAPLKYVNIFLIIYYYLILIGKIDLAMFVCL